VKIMAMYEIYQDYPVSRDCEQSEKKPGSVKKKLSWFASGRIDW